MANVDTYLCSNEELTSLADAIRTKSNSQGKLTFPNGFITTINNLNVSGGPAPMPIVPKIQQLNINHNGTYNVPSGVDGYNPVIVNCPIPKEEISKTVNVTANGHLTVAPPLGKVFSSISIDTNVPISSGGSSALRIETGNFEITSDRLNFYNINTTLNFWPNLVIVEKILDPKAPANGTILWILSAGIINNSLYPTSGKISNFHICRDSNNENFVVPQGDCGLYSSGSTNCTIRIGAKKTGGIGNKIYINSGSYKWTAYKMK